MPRHFVCPLSSAPALPLDQGVVTLAFEDELACLPGINATSEHEQQPLSSDAKRNTPCRFAIGLVDQDLRECCHAGLFASAG